MIITSRFLRGEYAIGIVIALLVSSYLEFLYGSIYLGIIFLILFVISIYFLPKNVKVRRKSSLLTLFGIVIVLLVITYNYLTQGDIGNLDVMVTILGLSLIFINSSNRDVSAISRFTAWMSAFFISSFSILYSIPHYFGIPLPYYYGHYFVTLPVVSILKILGLNVSAEFMRIINVRGVEHVNLKIELSCFGWYSMLLALGTVFSYHTSLRRIEKRRLILISFAVFFASYLTNLLRVCILVVLTYFYGIDVMKVFHPHLGWILFALILIPLINYPYTVLKDMSALERILTEAGRRAKEELEEEMWRSNLPLG